MVDSALRRDAKKVHVARVDCNRMQQVIEILQAAEVGAGETSEWLKGSNQIR